MKLAVSNIAWPVSLRDAAYDLLLDKGVTGLEIAPGLFLAGSADPFGAHQEVLAEAVAAARARGLELVSMQSLLFGVNGAQLFGTPEERGVFTTALRRAIELAARLGVPYLVFGSPRQRTIPAGLDHDRAWQDAADLFAVLGEDARRLGLRIAIEPNAAAYGTNFLNRIEEALAFVRMVDHQAVTLNFDTGALIAADEVDRVEAIAAAAASAIGHVHFSEPMLAPAPASTQDALRVLHALKAAGHEGWCSIEMASSGPDPLAALASAIDRANAALLALKTGRDTA